jgi:putative nucleotide binding protein
MHSLEFLPGVGKKTMYQIIQQREIAPFESYEDLKDRAKISDLVSHITRRILIELREKAKYNIFTRPV